MYVDNKENNKLYFDIIFIIYFFIVDILFFLIERFRDLLLFLLS